MCVATHLSLDMLQSIVVFLLVLTMMNGRLIAELAAGEPCVANLSLLRLIRFLNDNTYKTLGCHYTLANMPLIFYCTCKSNSFASSFFCFILCWHSISSSYSVQNAYMYTQKQHKILFTWSSLRPNINLTSKLYTTIDNNNTLSNNNNILLI